MIEPSGLLTPLVLGGHLLASQVLLPPIERQGEHGVCDLGRNVSRVSQNRVSDREERGHP